MLASALLSNENDFFSMDDNDLNLLAKDDVLCHFLTQQARFGDMRQESLNSNSDSSSVAGVINLHLHVMHSLGKNRLSFIDIIYIYCKSC